ncbi:MAG: hypothetical protein JW870_11240 [Candidatus Delongbacteria bacterium]|nr:hypothetical protein [Candidatus Delongbacteria bacterium]
MSPDYGDNIDVKRGERPQQLTDMNESGMKRTLIIGLGGSGKEVLLRLRNKFYLTYGNPQGFPFIEFLWIDTDNRNQDINGKQFNEFIKMYTKFSVINSIPESIDIHIDRKTLSDIYSKFETFVNYRGWFAKDRLEVLGYDVLENGASAVRPFGRLAFWHHFDRIEKLLQKKFNNLRVVDDTPNINLAGADQIEVYIICSLAGGTGSGIFIDLGFLLQLIDRNCLRNGIFFLSDVFRNTQGMHRQRQANTYGAIKELEFYMNPFNMRLRNLKPELFKFSWDKRYKERSVDLPIFTTSYLIGDHYRDREIEKLKYDAFDMVAEYLFRDFDQTDLGNHKRAAKTNTRLGVSERSESKILTQIEGDGRIEFPFLNCYAAISLGEISLDIRRLKNLGIYKFMSMFYEDLIHEKKSEKIIEYEKENFIKNLSYDNLKFTIEIGKEKISVVKNLITKLDSKIDEFVNALIRKIQFNQSNYNYLDKIVTEKTDELNKYFEKLVEDIKVQIENRHNQRGEIFNSIEINYKQVLEERYSKIKNRTFELLSERGFNTANDFLNECVNKIRYLNDNISNKIDSDIEIVLKTPEKPEIKEVYVKDLFERIEDSHKIPVYFFFYRKIAVNVYRSILHEEIRKTDKKLTCSLTNYAEEFKAYVMNWAKNRIEGLIESYISTLLENLLKRIDQDSNKESLRSLLSNFKKVCNAYMNQYSGFIDSFSNTVSDSPSRKIVLDEEINFQLDFNEYIERFNEKSINRDELNIYDKYSWLTQQLDSPLIRDMQKEFSDDDNSMVKFCKILSTNIQNRNTIINQINKSIEKHVKSNFKEFLQNYNVEDVVTDLITNNPEFMKSIEEVLRRAGQFRLPIEQYRPPINNVIDDYTTSICGVPNLTNQGFLNRLELNEFEIYQHNSPESIIFIKEGSGFPIFYIRDFDELKLSYKNETQDDVGLLARHTTKHFYHFYDILPPETSEKFQDLISNLEPAFEAIMLGLIEFKIIYFDKQKKRVEDCYFLYNFTKDRIPKKRNVGRSIEEMANIFDQDEDLQYQIKNGIRDINFEFSDLLKFWEVIYMNRKQIIKNMENLNISEGSVVIEDIIFQRLQRKYEGIIKQKLSESKQVIDEDDFYNDLIEKIDRKEFNKLNYFTLTFKEGIYIL